MLLFENLAYTFVVLYKGINKCRAMEIKNAISSLLSYGDITAIAGKLKLSPGATSAALRRGNPGHPAVREAVRMAQESGALATAQALASLSTSK